MEYRREFSSDLGPDGPLAASLGSWEAREGQIAMAEAVAHTLRAGGELLVEAGTGTGKTFAYALPALLHARSPDRRVVISTWTRHLQEQLVERDLPALVRAFALPPSFTLVQGRENYVCRRRAEEALTRELAAVASPERLRPYREVAHWAANSSSAHRGELGVLPAPEVWERVRAERGNCLGARSPFFGQCGWQWTKRRARESAVLVVNHAVLLMDVVLRRSGSSILPPYTALVVDEAHHLEEVAVQCLGASVGPGHIFGLLRRIERAFAQRAPGVAAALHSIQDRVEAWFRELASSLDETGTREWRGTAGDRAVEVVEGLEQLASALDRCAREEGEPSRAKEAETCAERCAALAQELEHLRCAGDPGEVYWLERDREGASLHAAPIDPAPLLREELFAPLEAVVLTSATLTTRPRADSGEDAFEFLRRTVGLPEAEGLVVASPFDYSRQAELVVDLALDPRDEDLSRLAEAVVAHVARSRGRALVLFTNRRVLRQVADAVSLPLEEEHGIRVFEQGRSLPRGELLERFRREQPAALLGLASFWEGIDLPGDTLSHVIVTRLPFRVPDHPRERRRAELWSRRGLDPFRDLALPEAVLRWKQGFGRLIRKQDDRGRVTVLDRRVLRSSFGRAFLDALPDCPRLLWMDGEEVPLEAE